MASHFFQLRCSLFNFMGCQGAELHLLLTEYEFNNGEKEQK